MRQFTVLVVTLCFTLNLSAQIGVNAGYRTNSADGWEKFFEGKDFLNQGFKVGVDYWFRLKKRRVEFTPELSYTRFNSSFSTGSLIGQVDQEFTATFIGLDFHTNLYLLDFASDCDCPTFSKDGSILDAGFFVQLSPGVAYGDFSAASSSETGETRNESTNATAFKFGIGVGLDIGISDGFTITPMVNWQRYFGMEWENLGTFNTNDVIPEGADETTDLDQLFFGLKLQVRLDELRGY